MILEEFKLDGKVAVVTGASKGMGFEIAKGLAEAGADIVAVSRTPSPALEEAILSLGRRYAHIAADLTKREESKQIIPMALQKMGTVNILINNAGIIRRAAAMEYAEQDWDSTMEIDLNCVFILSQAAAQVMKKNGGGKIISIASVLGFQGGMNVVAYASAKHGVIGLTKALSNDWAKYGINVNAIAPSYIETELTSALQADKARYESIKSRTPADRWGKPRDLCGAAVFLASSAADYVHGVTLPVDGGWLGF